MSDGPMLWEKDSPRIRPARRYRSDKAIIRSDSVARSISLVPQALSSLHVFVSRVRKLARLRYVRGRGRAGRNGEAYQRGGSTPEGVNLVSQDANGERNDSREYQCRCTSLPCRQRPRSDKYNRRWSRTSARIESATIVRVNIRLTGVIIAYASFAQVSNMVMRSVDEPEASTVPEGLVVQLVPKVKEVSVT